MKQNNKKSNFRKVVRKLDNPPRRSLAPVIHHPLGKKGGQRADRDCPVGKTNKRSRRPLSGPTRPVHVLRIRKLRSSSLARARAARNPGPGELRGPPPPEDSAPGSRQPRQKTSAARSSETATGQRQRNSPSTASGPCPSSGSIPRSAELGWHYLSSATCLIQPHLFSTALVV